MYVIQYPRLTYVTRLMQIKVPDTFSRVPKSLKDANHWKGMLYVHCLCLFILCRYPELLSPWYILTLCLVGSEVRSWLLYFSLPVLDGILPVVYFRHLSLLIAALHILTSDYIRISDLQNSRLFLTQFYERFAELYGKVAVHCT